VAAARRNAVSPTPRNHAAESDDEPLVAGVLVEHGDQEFFALRRRRFDHLAAAEGEANAVALAAAVYCWEAVADGPLDGVLDRAGEDLAVGKVFVSVAVDPAAARDGQLQIGTVRRGEANLVLAVQVVGQPLLAFADAAPRRNRIVVMQQPGAEHEFLVRRERHLGILRRGVARKLRAAPAERSGSGPFEKLRHHRPSTAAGQGLLGRVDAGERLRVVFAPQADGDVEFLDRVQVDRIGERQLLVVALQQFNFRALVEVDGEKRIAAGANHGPIKFDQ